MRTLDEINDFSDIYQPVPDEDIESAEAILGFSFPEDYRRFVAAPDIELIKRLPSLLWFVRHRGVGLIDVNRRLRTPSPRAYTARLVAFATNECGDYYCFDRQMGRIVYIDPDRTVEESLRSGGLIYESFEQWMEQRLQRRRRGGAGGDPTGGPAAQQVAQRPGVASSTRCPSGPRT